MQMYVCIVCKVVGEKDTFRVLLLLETNRREHEICFCWRNNGKVCVLPKETTFSIRRGDDAAADEWMVSVGGVLVWGGGDGCMLLRR